MQRHRLFGFLLFLFAAIAVVSAPADQTAHAAENQSLQETAGGAYRIQPGDVMTIVVYGQPDLTLDVLVLPDGTISYPFVGVLDVRNLTAAEVAERVTEVLSTVIRTPVVSVNVRPGKGPSVVVLGEVRVPGVYPVAGQTVDLLEAIALAGGTTPMADLAKVKVYQRGNVRDYKEAPIGAEGVLFEGEAAENPPVAVGNIVYVPPLDAEREIFVLGEVRNPGAYPLEPGRQARLLELIARAGGTTPSADLARVRIYDGGDIRDFREAPIGARGVLFEGEAADNPVVEVGHIVYVPPLEAAPEIFVLGEVRNPGAYPLEPGREPRLLELIARAGGTTPSADLARVRIYDGGDIRDFREAPIGSRGVLFEGEVADNPVVAVGHIVYVPPLEADPEIFVLGEVRNPGAYPVEPGRQPRLLELIARAGGTTPSADLARVRIYDGGDIRDFREAPIGSRGVLFEGEAADNPVVAVGHIVYVPPLEAELEIFILGEVQNPGAYPVEPGRQPRLLELIARAGGTTPLADLAQVKIYDGGDIRDFREAPIGTGDVLFEGEAAENPVVEVGNIVYVPRGVVKVTVMGLVARPGTLEVRAGERVLGVLAQAGGVLPEADPSGIILRRELPSGEAVTTVVNIERILAGDEGAENPMVQPGDVIYVRPTIQVAVAGEVRTNGVFRLRSQSRVTDAILAAGGATENADLSRLTITRSTLAGQEVIPVDFEAILAGRGENLLLQDGDIVNVPRTSRVVYVAGEVARPGAYPYLPGARLIDAVYQAGGPTLDADVDNVTLYTEHDQEIFSGSLYQNPPVEPGQTVYVPSKVMEVFVVGESSVTGRVQVPRDSRLLDVVAAIGGPEPRGNWRAVRIYRNQGEEPASYTVDVEALLREPASSANLRILEGDVIYVPADVAAVSVIGEVARPGTYTLSGNTRLVDALAAAGGAGERAALERVNVLQSGERLQVNLGLYDRLDAEKVRESGVELEDGGVVVVPRSNRIRWQDVITFLTGVKLIKDLLED